MKIDRGINIDDAIPSMLIEAHSAGSFINAGMPCSICSKSYEMGNDIIIRDHFHGSDFGACKRKVFLFMKTGIRSTSQSSVFLADGHLHEASILKNLSAGLGDGWKIKAMENQSEKVLNVMGFQIYGHIDAILYNDYESYIIECKSVKDYTFKKVKSGEISNEWYGQMQAYMLMMDMNRTYLIVKHRESSTVLAPIRIDKNITFIVDRLNALSEIHTNLIQGLEQPDREHKTPKDSECKFCPFKVSCWGIATNEEEVNEYFEGLTDGKGNVG